MKNTGGGNIIKQVKDRKWYFQPPPGCLRDLFRAINSVMDFCACSHFSHLTKMPSFDHIQADTEHSTVKGLSAPRYRQQKSAAVEKVLSTKQNPPLTARYSLAIEDMTGYLPWLTLINQNKNVSGFSEIKKYSKME